jgi:integrase
MARRARANLLDDPNLKRWYSNIRKGSVISAEIYLRALGRFCEYAKMTPKQFAELPLEKIEDMTQDFIDEFEAKYSPGYLGSLLKVVRSWANWNRKPFQRKIKISNPNKRPTLENERAPTKDELKRVLHSDMTSLRARASISLIGFSGVRLEVLGDYLGLDGLRVKDFPEMELSDGKVSFSQIPTIIVVREELSKVRRRYLTFMCEEGCEIIKEYLERRMSEGESLRPDSGIIATTPTQARKSAQLNTSDRSPFLRTTKVGDEIRKAMRAVQLPWRPYVFRTYFDTTLMLAESKGLVSHAYQQFWMGHTGDIEAQYTTNKNRLPDSVVEDMRESYKKVSELLQTKSESVSEEKIKRTFKEQFLVVAGFQKEEIENMNLDDMTNEELQSLVRKRLVGMMTSNGSRQKVIPIQEVRSYIGQGFEYVASLPNDEAIVKVPF